VVVKEVDPDHLRVPIRENSGRRPRNFISAGAGIEAVITSLSQNPG